MVVDIRMSQSVQSLHSIFVSLCGVDKKHILQFLSQDEEEHGFPKNFKAKACNVRVEDS